MLVAGSVATVISRGDLGTENVAGVAGTLLATTQACSGGSSSAAAVYANSTAATATSVQGAWGDVWAALQALAAQQCYVLAVDGTRLFPSHATSAGVTPQEVRTRRPCQGHSPVARNEGPKRRTRT